MSLEFKEGHRHDSRSDRVSSGSNTAASGPRRNIRWFVQLTIGIRETVDDHVTARTPLQNGTSANETLQQ